MTHDQSLAAALGRVPSGLFILTAGLGDRATGMLASWVQQCSFDPPQISVAIKPGRPVHGLLSNTAAFVVNIVPAGNSDLLKHFGKGFELGEPAFVGLDIYPAPSGVPILRLALCHLDCIVVGRHTAGDHELVIGKITGGRMHSDGQPALHVRKSGAHY